MMITMNDIKKTMGGTVLFEALHFEMKVGERVGLVGRNGSGKSTLFKLITQEEPIDAGALYIQKNVSIGHLKQIPDEWEGTAKAYLLSAFDDLMKMVHAMNELEQDMVDPEKMDKALKKYGDLQEQFTQAGGYEIEANIEKIAHGLGIYHLLDQKFAQLSGGEKTKLGLAMLLLEQPNVLLLDEPTNHLDLNAIEWLENYLTRYDGAVCIISHDRTFLDQTVDRVADLESGEITSYKGNYIAFEKQKEEKLLAEFQAYQEQQKKIKKMKEAIRRLRQWANEANPPNEKLFKKAKSMERALERMEKKEKPLIDPKKMKLALDADGRSGTDVFLLQEVRKSFGNRDVLTGVDLHLRYKERLAIVGANGSGKSTLLHILLGKGKEDQGTVQVGSSMEIGYLPQEPLQGADPEMRMIDYFREHIRVTEGQARHILAAFMFYGYHVFHKIRQLSGGEQMRLKLAIFMHQGINVLILDEPTNHLDIESQEVLEEAVEKFAGTVLAVSHDRYFLNACFPETAYLVDGKLHRYLGNYDATQTKWKELQEMALEKVERKSVPDQQKRTPESPIIDEADVEEQILALEEQLEQLQLQMAEEQDVDQLMEAQDRKETLEKERDRLYEHWITS
ncbi:ribosomal protection-like ABC-F family protein [Thalassobacillus hwangdonensis]|uniref:Ribosomal protection-like ABC-F family protein n=1 Tax=Thalassobacillus hwangdonensis TaxID=546108 RepID=A0ABW3L2H7_9BACI